MDTEMKRISVSLLWVTGIMLLVFSFFVYFVDPSAWRVALALNMSFLVVYHQLFKD